MKNSAVKQMIACQYNVDVADVHVEFLYYRNGLYSFDVKVYCKHEQKPEKFVLNIESKREE